jgi:glycosyltransferase involved in cell wall biosynthesis
MPGAPGTGASADAAASAKPPAKLRIAHAILSQGLAGSEHAAAEACNQMCREHDVALIVRDRNRGPGGASILDNLDPRVTVIQVPGWPFTRRAVARALETWRPDVVHTHLRRSTRYVAQARSGAVHFCTLHMGLNGPHFLQCDGLVCITDWQLATVPAHYRGRVFLVHNALVPRPRLDPGRRAALRRELGAADGEFLIGAVGRLARSKGFDLLIEAFLRANLSGASLAIVGAGREQRRLERQAGGRVHFAGFRHDARDCFQAFDVAVCPSRTEPFGRVIIEALDAGTPVIASASQGPSDIARRFPVELVAVGDVPALAEALRRAAARPRERLSPDLSEFHVERVTARLLDAYREVIAARAG